MRTVQTAQIVQIVPQLPVPPEGVGGYAEALAGALRDRSGIETRFVVGSVARTVEALLDALADAPVALLHYANYGYQRRGCPTWLVEGLVRWLQRGAGRRLVTVFHEVYATGPPWRSSFWLSPLQQKLAATLARSSAALATSLDLYSRMLRPWVPQKRIAVLPVFSTVGEPAVVPRLDERSRRLVVFGGTGVRRRAWGRLPALARTVAALGIEEVVDVGPPVEAPPRVGEIPVRTLGVLPAGEVSELLRGSLAGFVAYPEPFLAKSTIFAAYCAHGMVPVCAGDGRKSPDPDPPFWTPGSALADPQGIADRARAWYAGHALDRQAEVYRELLS